MRIHSPLHNRELDFLRKVILGSTVNWYHQIVQMIDLSRPTYKPRRQYSLPFFSCLWLENGSRQLRQNGNTGRASMRAQPLSLGRPRVKGRAARAYKKAHACAAGSTHGRPRHAVLLIGFPFFPKKKIKANQSLQWRVGGSGALVERKESFGSTKLAYKLNTTDCII